MPPSSQSPARLRPFRPVQFDRYTLLAALSSGGMGEVYLARLEGAHGFEKLCVIKKILPHLAEDKDFLARFTNEAKTLVKLSHGSIAQVFDMGFHGTEPFIALEYVDGKDLRKIAARSREINVPPPLPVVLYIACRVLDALAYAHRKRDDNDRELSLVHRDVSPQNILVSYEGEVKVIDFGLAKSTLSAAHTHPSVILGKFLYMPPEQARHQQVDRRADLFSVGMCLYELIAGKHPLEDLRPGELMAKVGAVDIPPLGDVAPTCPPLVAAAVMKALSPSPADRFPSAEDFRGRLTAEMLALDPQAGPESVSRYVREIFAADYQSERKLLSTFRDPRFLGTAGARNETGIHSVTARSTPVQLKSVSSPPDAPAGAPLPPLGPAPLELVAPMPRDTETVSMSPSPDGPLVEEPDWQPPDFAESQPDPAPVPPPPVPPLGVDPFPRPDDGKTQPRIHQPALPPGRPPQSTRRWAVPLVLVTLGLVGFLAWDLHRTFAEAEREHEQALPPKTVPFSALGGISPPPKPAESEPSAADSPPPPKQEATAKTPPPTDDSLAPTPLVADRAQVPGSKRSEGGRTSMALGDPSFKANWDRTKAQLLPVRRRCGPHHTRIALCAQYERLVDEVESAPDDSTQKQALLREMHELVRKARRPSSH